MANALGAYFDAATNRSEITSQMGINTVARYLENGQSIKNYPDWPVNPPPNDRLNDTQRADASRFLADLLQFQLRHHHQLSDTHTAYLQDSIDKLCNRVSIRTEFNFIFNF
jgi:hypothetical protein